MRSSRRMPLALLLVAALALAASQAVAQQPAPAATPATAGIRWQTNLEQATKVAQQTQKLVLLHFWAPWCKNCLQMDSQIFNQPAVAAAIEQHYVPVKLNADQYRASAESYGIDSLPTDIILSGNGQVITKFNSPTTASAYVTRMNQIALSSRPRGGAVGAAPVVPAANPYAGIGGQSSNVQTSNVAVAPAAPTTQLASAPVQQSPVAAPPVVSGGQPLQISNPHVPGSAAPAPANAVPAAGQDRNAAPAQDRYAAAPQDRYAAPAGDRYAAPQDRYAPAQDVATSPAPAAPPATTPSAPPQDRYAAPAPSAPTVGGTPVIDPFANRQASTGQGYGNQYAPPPAVQTGPYGSQPVAAAPPAMSQRPQPTGHPTPAPSEFGLDGYCSVTLLESQRWVQGDRRFGAVHRGRTYLFTSSDAQKRFMTNPDYYAPALSGVDPVLAIDQQQSVPGQRKHGVFYENQVYLFSGEASLMRFGQNPQRYVEGVRQAMKAQDGRVLR